MDIKEILVNGEPYEMKGQAYTASDDGKCTRVNLYNSWVSTVPDEGQWKGTDTLSFGRGDTGECGDDLGYL